LPNHLDLAGICLAAPLCKPRYGKVQCLIFLVFRATAAGLSAEEVLRRGKSNLCSGLNHQRRRSQKWV
jgi:hypothetical protein